LFWFLQIYVPPPDDESRLQILQLELRKMPLTGNFNYPEMVVKTAGFSGAEVVAVCSEAAMLAIEEKSRCMRYEHMLTAIQEVKPQITPQMLQFYKSCAALF
jgi:SpoVK/Ycf46/Vps4 family AAA+-type ATPase